MQDDINTALTRAGIAGFTGKYDELGGGEVNNTYKLHLDDRQLVLRIAKDRGQATLINEASALKLYDDKRIPELIYFNENARINERLWILESCLPGSNVTRLSPEQFYSLGSLLANVHTRASDGSRLELRKQFIETCKSFGDEQFLLQHPDSILRGLIRATFEEFDMIQSVYGAITPMLIHSDATPSNILVDGDEVGLIDWEFSKYSDPMCDFSTIYYEDMEYNQGKWRIRIADEEKRALFDGYRSAGGKIDEERIRFWIKFDKLGAAVFLYWRIHHSNRATSDIDLEQYKLDYDNLLASLTSQA